MNVRENLFYTKEHEWVKLEGESATIGITDYAQHSLGDITFVELPETGSSFKRSDTLATIESVKAASDIYAPVAGQVERINQDIIDNPELVNQSPYDKAWFATMRLTGQPEKGQLLSAEDYKNYIKELG
jgi:glycine cleavage system H protein